MKTTVQGYLVCMSSFSVFWRPENTISAELCNPRFKGSKPSYELSSLVVSCLVFSPLVSDCSSCLVSCLVYSPLVSSCLGLTRLFFRLVSSSLLVSCRFVSCLVLSRLLYRFVSACLVSSHLLSSRLLSRLIFCSLVSCLIFCRLVSCLV